MNTVSNITYHDNKKVLSLRQINIIQILQNNTTRIFEQINKFHLNQKNDENVLKNLKDIDNS